VIVGAGIAGLVAANRLRSAGFEVILLDKGRRPGGRMATRELGRGRLDHGAQFITVRAPAFKRLIESWQEAGIATEWCRGFARYDRSVQGDGHPRFRGVTGMNAIPAHLSKGLDIRVSEEVEGISIENRGWHVSTISGSTVSAGALIMTCPVPQSMAILDRSRLNLPHDVDSALRRITYDPCLAVLAVLDKPSRIPAPGGVQLLGEPISWIADNRLKGISPQSTTLTIHASPTYSEDNLEADPGRTLEHLLAAASQWSGATVREATLHRWRYSQPTVIHPHPCLAAREPAPLVFAGDAFGGPRVEGAALSGLAAAEVLLEPGT
jgi:predicted NAD/FAD-dependent oxidoreductase